MPQQYKIDSVKKMEDELSDKKNLIFANFQGMPVEKQIQMRRKLTAEGVAYKVVKNNLFKIALKNQKMDGLEDYLSGPTGVAFVKDDMVVPCKIFTEFEKESKLKIKGGYTDGKAVGKETIDALSKLPPKEELIAKLLMVLKSPISGLLNVLQGPARKLTILLNKISEKDQDQ